MEAFRLGGHGMWLTLIWGAALLAASIRYAVKPEKRFVPLVASLGVVTLLSGALGFTSGVILSLMALQKVAPDERYIVGIGVAESLYNVAFALLLTLFGAIAVTIGTMRQARETRVAIA